MGKKRGCTTRGCIFRDCRHGAASATRAGGGGDATLFGGQGNVDGAARCYSGGDGHTSPGTCREPARVNGPKKKNLNF